MVREIRFNVGGDPRDDQPWIQPDHKVDAAGTPISGKPDPIPITLGHEDPDGTFHAGAEPKHRGSALIPEDNTGGADVFKNGQFAFRIILPPLNIQVQAEAGEPPQLPPEYNGNADKVALHYGPPKPISNRGGRVHRIGNSFADDGGPFNPLGDTLLYALGHWWRGGALRELVKENVAFIASYGHEHVRWLGEVNWSGQEIDPNWPNYESTVAEMLDWMWNTCRIRSHITVTGGGGNARLAAQKLRNAIAGREHTVLLSESVNERNDSGANAIWIAQFMRQAGVLVSTGRGDAGLETIRDEGNVAGSDIDDLHTERGLGDTNEAGGPHARQVRQCWDFNSLRSNAMKLDGEGPGPNSSVAVLDDPFYLALRRFANVACGAEAQTCHFGAGVYGKDYQSSYGFRHARFRDIPNIDRIMRGLRAADRHIPKGVANWRAFNTHPELPLKPVVDGQCNKINGCRTGRDFVETIIGSITGPLALRAEQALTCKIVNPETADVLFDGHLAQGQVLSVEGLQGYGIIGVAD